MSLVFNFGYLAFFRMAAYFGFEEVSTGTPNAVQLILSLKVRNGHIKAGTDWKMEWLNFIEKLYFTYHCRLVL